MITNLLFRLKFGLKHGTIVNAIWSCATLSAAAVAIGSCARYRMICVDRVYQYCCGRRARVCCTGVWMC
jgi:hypothetical protein